MTLRFTRIFVTTTAIVLALGAMLLTSAWVFHIDDRELSHSTMVGTLEVDLPEGLAQGTAVLVDSCGILTNFHIVFGPWYVTAMRAPSRQFPGTFTLTAATLPDGTHPTARAIPVVWGDYLGPDRQYRHPENDWAYLALDPCLGEKYRHFHMQPFDLYPSTGTKDSVAAYGYSTGEQMLDPACSVDAERSTSGNRSWRHDCSLELGDSGGPIIKQASMVLIALNANIVGDPSDPECRGSDAQDEDGAHSRMNVRCANVAVPLTRDIIDRVKAAHLATQTQRALNALGYKAGPLGAIGEPLFTSAIEQAQRDMGWAVTGEPTDTLRKILWLNVPSS